MSVSGLTINALLQVVACRQAFDRECVLYLSPEDKEELLAYYKIDDDRDAWRGALELQLGGAWVQCDDALQPGAIRWGTMKELQEAYDRECS